MRAFFSKLFQALGALACLAGLACGLGVVSVAPAGLGWQLLLLLLGLVLLALGVWLRREPHS